MPISKLRDKRPKKSGFLCRIKLEQIEQIEDSFKGGQFVRLSLRLPGSRLRLFQQFSQIISNAGGIEIWLSLEGLLDVMGGGRISIDLDDGQDKVVGLVERGQYFIVGDGDGFSSHGTPFDFDEAQFACARDRAIRCRSRIFRS